MILFLLSIQYIQFPEQRCTIQFENREDSTIIRAVKKQRTKIIDELLTSFLLIKSNEDISTDSNSTGNSCEKEMQDKLIHHVKRSLEVREYYDILSFSLPMISTVISIIALLSDILFHPKIYTDCLF